MALQPESPPNTATGMALLQENRITNADDTLSEIPTSNSFHPSQHGPIPLDDVDSDSDLEYDKYRMEVNPEAPRKISERRRVDKAFFESFLSNLPTKIAKTAQEGGQYASQDFMSVTHMVKEHEGKKIISSPREYQLELFERAKEKNIIAVLETGTGKTLIAALLLRHTIDRELENRAAGQPRKVAFFLVDKVALVFQQHAVLECNFGHPVGRYCGDLVDGQWTNDFWAKELNKYDVVVCTAAILQKMLMHSFITINQISLLVFDECHHAKRNHPYARIIKDFYVHERDEASRPRIFGMTASPVDAQCNITYASQELETLLASEIATVPETMLTDIEGVYLDRHRESQERFKKLPAPYYTTLCKRIAVEVQDNAWFKKPLNVAKRLAAELGEWCADRYWHIYLTQHEVDRLKARTTQDEQKRTWFFDGPQIGDSGKAIEKVQEIVASHEFREPVAEVPYISTKVAHLRDILTTAFALPTSSRCIIFVDQRFTAKLLTDFLSQPGMSPKYLKVAAVVGSQQSGPLSMSFRDQFETIVKFRRGDFNCLISTSVAEEGIDIPACDLVIRFDIFTSAIQYIQSRGRARMKNSKYIVLYEEGNGGHSRMLGQARRDANTLQQFCAAQPDTRKLTGSYNITFDTITQIELAHTEHTIPKTGAKLTFAQSLEILENFIATLPPISGVPPRAHYLVHSDRFAFTCEIAFPESAPIRSKAGTPQRSKNAARASAAFEACMELLRRGYIDNHLRPVFTKKLPSMRNARLAISPNQKQKYQMRIKPDIWSLRGPCNRLFTTVLSIENPEAVGRSSRPLVLLTREQLPDLPCFPLFFGNGRRSMVRVTSICVPIEMDKEQIETLKTFTLRIFDDVFSKIFEAEASEMPYFLAPTTKNHGDFCGDTMHYAADILDWECIDFVRRIKALDWDDNAPDTFFTNKFAVDRYNGGRKLFLRGVRRDMKPSELVPEGVPDPGHRAWKDSKHTIMEYSISAWGASRARMTWRDSQPVVEAELASLRRNLLDEFDANRDDNRPCWVILEPFRVSALPTDVVAMVYTFPAIIHRIESNLIALDACNLLKLQIRPDLALEALTKDSDNSNEHNQEQINFQGGMGRNYERLEFLGDSFLKMATTISLFTCYPDCDEFRYHVERMLMVANKNLMNTAVDMKLEQFVRSKSFNRRTWYPDGLKLVKGKAIATTRDDDIHLLALKSIADVCEALIGAAYLTYTDQRLDDFDMAVRAVTAVVKSKKHTMMSFADYFAAYKMPEWQSKEGTAVQQTLVKRIKESTDYGFKSAPLAWTAFKHASWPQSYCVLPNYERLEFLGDALLDMVVVDHLFRRFPEADPQWLTEHKMAMVSNQFLALVCVKLGFHKYIRVFNLTLEVQLKEYVVRVREAEEEATLSAQEAARSEGISPQTVAYTEARRNFWVNIGQAPKCLADLVESYIGAVFVDSNYDYGTVRAFFDAYISPWFDDMSLYDDFSQKHPASRLSQLIQDEFRCQDWRMIISELPADEGTGAACVTETQVACGLLIHGKVVEHAFAASGRYAKAHTATKALRRLERMTKEEFRTEWKCDCDPPALIEGDLLANHATAI